MKDNPYAQAAAPAGQTWQKLYLTTVTGFYHHATPSSRTFFGSLSVMH